MSTSVAAAAPAAYSPPASFPTTCPNCDAGAVGDFCHRCGGRVAVSRLTLRALGAEVLSQVVELDHGVLHTLVTLLKRPGATIRGYFDGRRRGLTSPLAFVTISVALSLLMTSAIPKVGAMREEQLKSLEQYRVLYSPVQYDFFVKLEHGVMQDKVMLLVLLLVPTTLMMRFLFRKQKLNIAETGAMVCYMYGATTYVGAVLALPLAMMHQASIELTLGMLLSIGFLIYFAYGVYGRSFRTTWRTLWAYLAAMLLMQGALIMVPYIMA